MIKNLILMGILLFPVAAISDEVWLYVMFHDDNSSGERFRTRMQNMDQCIKAVQHSKLPMPDRPSGDYEVMGAMWCGGRIERQYNAAWWRDDIKGVDK